MNAQQNHNQSDFIIINNTGIKRDEITTFYWDEDTLELNIKLKSGDEHFFCFESKDGLREIIWSFKTIYFQG